MHMLHKFCLPLFWFLVPFCRSLPLIMGVNADLNGLVSICNKSLGVIGFNVLLPISSSVTVLLVYQVSCYLCHLWGVPLILTILVHLIYLFFGRLMDNVDFSPL